MVDVPSADQATLRAVALSDPTTGIGCGAELGSGLDG
jgi:hypothetical protein